MTAFSTPDGDKYEFNRLCFGLKNSPKAFQSIAQEVLGDLLHNGALVYIDDIILFTKTIDEHFELLSKVLERFEKIQLKFNSALPDTKDLIEMQRNDPVLSDIIQKINSTEAGLQRQVYFLNEEGLLCRLSRRPSKSPRQSVRTQRRINQSRVPGETCHIDIFAHLKPTPRDNKFVFSMIDAFTKYIHLVPLPDLSPARSQKLFLTTTSYTEVALTNLL
ncbi:hypothetical protein TNIN_375291 [Trichonephila inaurata madagascariensis]|uniref:Reverse transcriptase domain-containing protein n=1 Tax=Trichonephila inaurata madagascariensis TaxID=2747483 RepID=A0A8X7BR55_9ARAC|nr:hypothetical protein TNIN_375291 [Trichonephila inaurata madagascariensis]